MFGRYPDRRALARRSLTAVLFVALLVPLMIPKVPCKGLNAVVFFGVFPVVGFMLLLGTALPFGLFGLLALILDVAMACAAAVLDFIVSIPEFLRRYRQDRRPGRPAGCGPHPFSPLTASLFYWIADATPPCRCDWPGTR